MQWIDKHSEMEVFNLVDTGISHWEKAAEAEGKYTTEAAEYVQLARAVLRPRGGDYISVDGRNLYTES